MKRNCIAPKEIELVFKVKIISFLMIFSEEFQLDMRVKGLTHSSGGSSRNRTGTPVRIHDFESCASTNSATEPCVKLLILHGDRKLSTFLYLVLFTEKKGVKIRPMAGGEPFKDRQLKAFA